MATAVTRVASTTRANPEVDETRVARRIAHDVGRLDVTVHHPVRVDVGQGITDGDPEIGDLVRRQGALDQAGGEGRTLDELQHDERRSVVLAGIEHPNEPGMVEGRQQPGLPVEAPPVEGRIGPEHLHRHLALQALVGGFEHIAHATP